jgi:uncharacterized UBP type Zn finger protein
VAETCTHVDGVAPVIEPRTPNGCKECLAMGDRWVHLRLCMACGHVGCCDNSKNKHATKHFGTDQHPLIRSYEPGEDWWYCYVDDLAFFVEGAPASPSHP